MSSVKKSFNLKKLATNRRKIVKYFQKIWQSFSIFVIKNILQLDEKEHLKLRREMDIRYTNAGGGGGGRSKREGIYVYLCLIHFTLQQELTQHCEAVILPSKKKEKEIYKCNLQEKSRTRMSHVFLEMLLENGKEI